MISNSTEVVMLLVKEITDCLQASQKSMSEDSYDICNQNRHHFKSSAGESDRPRVSPTFTIYYLCDLQQILSLSLSVLICRFQGFRENACEMPAQQLAPVRYSVNCSYYYHSCWFQSSVCSATLSLLGVTLILWVWGLLESFLGPDREQCPQSSLKTGLHFGEGWGPALHLFGIRVWKNDHGPSPTWQL